MEDVSLCYLNTRYTGFYIGAKPVVASSKTFGRYKHPCSLHLFGFNGTAIVTEQNKSLADQRLPTLFQR